MTKLACIRTTIISRSDGELADFMTPGYVYGLRKTFLKIMNKLKKANKITTQRGSEPPDLIGAPSGFPGSTVI
jgi:hypothetical protein